MELEKAGECYEPQLKRLARNVLRQRYTDGVIDEMLAPEKVTYEDLARASSDTSSAEPPSILKSIFHDTSGNDGLLAAWLVSDARDAEIEAKEATRELTKLVRSRLGLELPEDAAWRSSDRSRFATFSQVSSGAISAALRRRASTPFRRRRRRTRKPRCESSPVGFARASPRSIRRWPIAWRTSSGFATRRSRPSASERSTRSVSRKRALLAHCGELVADEEVRRGAAAGRTEREHSFWLDRDVGRKAQWEACRRMAELGSRGDVRASRRRQGRRRRQRLGRRLHVQGRLVPPGPGAAASRGLGREPR